MNIRTAIVENNIMFRETLRDLLSSHEHIECVACFEDAESFSSRFMDLQVHVVLMDIRLPGSDGIKTIARFKHRRPEVQFVICSFSENPETIVEAFQSGATGYILKNFSPEEMIRSVKEAYEGGAPMSPLIARKVVELFQQRRPDAEVVQQLNEREWEIIALLDKGFRYKEIAVQLHFSLETVRTYVRNIYEKLEVHSRTDALNKVFVKN